MNPHLDRLQPYPFAKLNALKRDIPTAAKSPVTLDIGEPRHPPPESVVDAFIEHRHTLANYPLTRGNSILRQAIVNWLERRFRLSPDLLDSERHILPVNGTREALFAFAQAAIDDGTQPLVFIPNPFYQIYEGAALLAGAEPYFMNISAASGFLPELESIPKAAWSRCQLFYLCSPGNPAGAVADISYLERLLTLAAEYDFIIASDECYSELYFDENAPPPGLLQAAVEMGNDTFEHCMVFHSLSKRSNLPGLRSGFVAGNAAIIERFLLYRTYHGCAMSPPVQAASTTAWQDEEHVIQNRALYRRKFDAVMDILQPVMQVHYPDAGFYLWPTTPLDDTEFTRELFAQQNVTVLPGSFLSREAHGINPGTNHIRMALVAEFEECVEAAQRIREFIEQR